MKHLAIVFLGLVTGSLATPAWASSYYAWDYSGYCNEYAPNGAVVTSHVSDSICRNSQGSYDRWDTSGYCNEYAPNGSIVTSHIADSRCRETQGSSYKWDYSGYCNEYAPNGST